MSQLYVIEIELQAWNPLDPRNKSSGCGSLISLHPFHADEEGSIYFRRQASLIRVNLYKISWCGPLSSLHSLYTNEEGSIYFMQQASLVKVIHTSTVGVVL